MRAARDDRQPADESSDSSSNDIIIAINQDPEHAPIIKAHYHPDSVFKRRLFLLIPIVTALQQASQTTLSLEQQKKSRTLSIVIPLLTFVTAAGLNNRFTFSSVDKFSKILALRALPRGWEPLPHWKEALIISATGLSTAYIIFTNGLQSYTYVDGFPAAYGFEQKLWPPGWIMANVGFSSVTGVYVILSQGWEIYNTLRHRAAGRPIGWTASCSQGTSLILSLPLNLVGAFESYLYSLSAVVDYFSIESSPLLITLALLSLNNAFGDFATSGRYRLQSMTKFFQLLSKRCPTLAETVAFLVSSGLCGFMYYHVRRELITVGLASAMDILVDVPALTPLLAEILSYPVAINYFINDTASLALLIHAGLGWSGRQVTALHHYLTERCRPAAPTDDETRPLLAEKIATPHANNPHVLFPPRTPELDPTPAAKPSKRCGGCTLL